jgi:hypothetical protein
MTIKEEDTIIIKGEDIIIISEEGMITEEIGRKQINITLIKRRKRSW